MMLSGVRFDRALVSSTVRRIVQFKNALDYIEARRLLSDELLVLFVRTVLEAPTGPFPEGVIAPIVRES